MIAQLKHWQSVAKVLRRLHSPAWIALVIICAMAVTSGYQISISLQDGFRFGPAKLQGSGAGRSDGILEQDASPISRPLSR